MRQAVRGCALEGDPDAAARGVFDGLFGPVVEVIVLQAATGRSQGGVVGIREHVWSARPTIDRGQHRAYESAEGVQQAGRGRRRDQGTRRARV